ncbi:MAG: hypothetical protein JF606_09850 [Burkholderiales bacterium]|nr:hypothetical protein [Burkholderiales bacterium]
MNHPSDLELRVLDGEQQGARCRVATNASTTVSGEWDSDIVLRGDGLAGRRVTVTPSGNGVTVDVLNGDARVGEQVVRQGERIELPWYTPLHLGDTVVAVGEQDGAWSSSSEERTHVADSVADDASADVQAAHTGHAHRWSRRLIVGGGALATVSMAVLAFAYAATPVPPTAAQLASRAEASLQAAGFPRLVVQASPVGEISVTGYLETNAQRARVEEVLASQPFTPRVSVWVNEQVASAVLDVYRVNGITAQAEVTGPGAVLVSTRESDVERLDQIKSVARRDVPGLSVIDARNVPPPPPPENTPVVEDPGKRVASIVPGDPSYVVTADGSRYFEGALLPTGHRIASIGEHEVVLEKGGNKQPLKF